MKLSTLLALPTALLTAVYASTTSSEGGEYREHLDLQPLPGGSLYAGFSFTATTPLTSYERQHFRYFPRSLAQILQYTHTAELHLRFSLGRWDEESWGRRPRDGLREGGNGVELWAWLEHGSGRSAEERWSDLVNSLSGLFCASLNFIDGGKTVRPLLSFESEGTLEDLQAARRHITGREQGELQLLHGMLPHEVVCTENLTPFLKLLPCKGKAGISSLLDGHKVFDASWQAMSVDVRPVCSEERGCELEIEQTVDMVLDIERSMRPRDDPIPRPLPIEEIECDEEMGYNGHDTCYPKRKAGEMAWSLSSIFGRSMRGSCTLGDGDDHDITLHVPSERTVDIVSNATVETSQPPDGTSRSYTIPESQTFDLSLPPQTFSDQQQDLHLLAQPPLYATRRMTGQGAERGGMHTLIRNPHPYAQRIVYLESLPWFLRPYMHTLAISGAKIEKMYYTPLLDRQRGTHLELLLSIPAASDVALNYDFEKAILRYTEYPPDANRGFDVAPAIIRVLPPTGPNGTRILSLDPEREEEQGSYYLRTTALLLPLPTPDFSMPYNVIILTSTVVALGFGSIFNLLVRRFVLVEEVPAAVLGVVVRRVRERVWGVVGKVKGGRKRDAVDAGKPDGQGVEGDRGGSGRAANGSPGKKEREGERRKDR